MCYSSVVDWAVINCQINIIRYHYTSLNLCTSQQRCCCIYVFFRWAPKVDLTHRLWSYGQMLLMVVESLIAKCELCGIWAWEATKDWQFMYYGPPKQHRFGSLAARALHHAVPIGISSLCTRYTSFYRVAEHTRPRTRTVTPTNANTFSDIFHLSCVK